MKNVFNTPSTHKFFNIFTRTFLLSVLLGLLIGLDFVLFLRSGTVFSLNNGVIIPVVTVLLYILGFAFVLMCLTCFSARLQIIVFSIFCCVLTWGVMNQFLQVDKSIYIALKLTPFIGASVAGLLNGYSHWVILAAIFVAVCYLLHNTTRGNIAYSAGIVLFIIIGFLGVDIMLADNAKQTEVVYQSGETDFNNSKQKVVFLLMPNAVAYSSIDKGTKNDVDKSRLLRKIELGFFARHGFKVYPNAYMMRDNQQDNLVEFFNILDNKPASQHTLNTVGLESLWKFKSPRKIDTVLKDNQLQDIYKKAKYKVNAYQNAFVEICKKNHQYTVDRCVSRSLYPFDIADTEFTIKERANLLLAQWISSFQIFNRQFFVDALDAITGPIIAKKMFLPYDRIYVAHSLQVLQQLLDDMIADQQSSVYFVYLDFPDDLFVYNEWCQIKPRHNWNFKKYDLRLPNVSSKIAEYNAQMLCFWGQMEDLMQNLKEQGLTDKLTFVIQGIGNTTTPVSTSDFIQQFKKNRTVLTAIRTPEGQFSVDNNICLSKDILRHNLFKTSDCREFEGLKISDSTQDELRKQLSENIVNEAFIAKATSSYQKWLGDWTANHQPFLKVNTVKTSETPESNHEGNMLEDDAVRALIGEGSLPVINRQESVQIQQPIITVKEEPAVNVIIEKPKIEDVPLEKIQIPVPQTKPDIQIRSENKKPDAKAKQKIKAASGIQIQQSQQNPKEIKIKTQNPKKLKLTVETKQHPQPVIVKTHEEPMHAEYHQDLGSGSVSGDFLIQEEETQWELDPAKALGVSGDEQKTRKIIVKVK